MVFFIFLSEMLFIHKVSSMKVRILVNRCGMFASLRVVVFMVQLFNLPLFLRLALIVIEFRYVRIRMS